MKILGIETSCDETAAAVVEDGTRVLSSVISSQIAKHALFGGVVPELAAREHLAAIDPVVSAALAEGGCTVADLGAVAVTHSPGLVPALLVGTAYAKGLAATGGVPLLGVNHFLAHVYGALLERPDVCREPARFPLLAVVVSGGHTALLLIRADGTTALVGRTLDDAAGEAFDKAAKILDLGYPGGPLIDRIAQRGDPGRVRFPRGLVGGSGRAVRAEDHLNFSFSGLKTALYYHVRDRVLADAELADVVASYQAAIVDVLVLKSRWAAEESGAATVVLCGGVACNSALRRAMAEHLGGGGRELIVAPPRYCTDNAAMVAGLAWHELRLGAAPDPDVIVGARLPEDLGRVPFAPQYASGTNVWSSLGGRT